MIVLNIYRKVLSNVLKALFDGPVKNLEVSGLFKFQNPKSIYIGNNVLIKSRVEFIPNNNLRSIMIGDNSEIHEYCVLRTFSKTGYIHIGQNTSLNRNGMIWGAGGITIGNDVRIGPRVNIATNNHIFQDRNQLIRKQGVTTEKVVIEDDIWIGANVTILAGVTIGKGSVIGAGSVVNKEIPPYSIYAGIPAKKIGER